MAFIDEISFHAKAGNGGAGVVRWRHEKGKEMAGASGGNAGKGGDVYVKAVRDLNILARHKSVKNFEAGKGSDGLSSSRQGSGGTDCIIELPIGSVVTNTESGRVVELLEEGQMLKILHGGKGGMGNEHFKASTNVRPGQSTGGFAGEEADFRVELDLIADAGLIGLPNAGKSSLLNALTNADAKVASYAFTTLDPNLGALAGGFILADIPGLIEGAAEGKGLGHKFLRHVKRTKLLLHLVSLEKTDLTPALSSDEERENATGLSEIESNYLTVRKELEKFGEGLTEKKEVIILTKTDLVDAKTVEKAIKVFSKLKKEVLTVSVLDDKAIKKLGEELVKLLK